MELPLDEFLIPLRNGIHYPGVVNEKTKPFPILIDIDGTKIVDDFDRIG
jgi:hypothetical protein